MSRASAPEPLRIGGVSIAPNERATVQVPVGHWITHELISVPVHVRRGAKPGPRLLVTAGLHGDEINGVEVVRRLLRRRLSGLAGDLIMIPVVNMPAFLARSRYLPDRRDLNRLFPGAEGGSFGARLARRLIDDIATDCSHAIDLHTGAENRPNLPQIRFDDANSGAKEMAAQFGAPVMIRSSLRWGSFRESLSKMGIPQIVYEGGQAGVLEPAPVRLAQRGILSVMRGLGMLNTRGKDPTESGSLYCHDSYWERAPRGGLFLPRVKLGDTIEPKEELGQIGDPFSGKTTPVYSKKSGVIIGQARNAAVDEGDGVFHVGLTHRVDDVAGYIEAAEESLDHGLSHATFD